MHKQKQKAANNSISQTTSSKSLNDCHYPSISDEIIWLCVKEKQREEPDRSQTIISNNTSKQRRRGQECKLTKNEEFNIKMSANTT